MDKKGEGDEFLSWEFIYVLLAVIFLVAMIIFVQRKGDNASVWEDYYAPKLANVLSYADHGTTFSLNVRKGVEIGLRNNQQKEQIFIFDNENNNVEVSLSTSTKAVFPFFKNVSVVDSRIEDFTEGIESHRLIFSVTDE